MGSIASFKSYSIQHEDKSGYVLGRGYLMIATTVLPRFSIRANQDIFPGPSYHPLLYGHLWLGQKQNDDSQNGNTTHG